MPHGWRTGVDTDSFEASPTCRRLTGAFSISTFAARVKGPICMRTLDHPDRSLSMTDTPYDASRHAKTGRGKVYDSILDTIGDTPLVRLPRLSAELKPKATVLAKLEFFNPHRLGQGPHRRGHDRGAGAGRKAEARRRHHRADQRQHRHRPGLRGRRQGLQADPGHAREHVDRAAQDAGPAGRRAGADPGREGHEGRHRHGQGAAGRHPRRGACRSSSTTRPTPPSTASPRPRRSGTTPPGPWTWSSRASAPAAPSPASARC